MPAVAAKPAIILHQTETSAMFRTPRERKMVLGLLLMVVTLALYNPVARSGFVNFDDDRYVTDNPQVRAGVHWGHYSGAFKSVDQEKWPPLNWPSHAPDCPLFRLNPAGPHYTNLLLHAINALLLFLILQWFTGYTARSLMVEALFAMHPRNVESVAWVAERKNVLCMLFFLLALAAYGRYVRRPGIVRYLVVALLFAMGLMSKPMVITLPFVLLLLDYWPFRRFAWGQPPSSVTAESGSAAACGHSDSMLSGALATQPPWRLCLEKLPLLALSAGSAVITMVAQRAGGAVLTSAAHSPLLRLENVLISYVLYINKSVWPSHLAALYPYPHALPAWQVAASAVFLLAVTCAVLKYGEHRYLPVGWFWYLGTMLPMIGLVQVGNQAMADRYVSLPVIGLFIIIVWGTAEWAGSRQLSAKYLAAAGLTILLALCALTRIHLSYWHDDYSLWARALAVTQGNFVAENNLAHALIKQRRYDEPISPFRPPPPLQPTNPLPH